MDYKSKDHELVCKTLKNVGYSIDESDDPDVFWVSHYHSNQEFEISMTIEKQIDVADLYFINHINLSYKINPMYYFRLNSLLNRRVNIGGFFLNKNNVLCFKTYCPYFGLKLTESMIMNTFDPAVYTPVIYYDVIKECLEDENLSNEEMKKIISSVKYLF